MCRLIGIVASEPTEFGLCLTEAPRCLARLSREHPDGWGLAIHDARGWGVHKGTDCADVDARFREVAARSRGNVLVAHVRQKTVGPTCIANTHPFARDGWVFAHNGTIKKSGIDTLRARCSAGRLAEVSGDTDSELLFAYFLTRLDASGFLLLADERARAAATSLLDTTTRELRANVEGAFNFLLSDGATCFAHRFGRTLFVLERGPGVVDSRPIAPGAALLTQWTARRRAVLVASERITDEPWREIPDGTLVRVDRLPEPTIVEPEAPHRAA
jgi:glutamine amidotransferase